MKTITAITGFILATAFFSCKKDNDKKAQCKLVTITQTSGADVIIQNITYNNDGRISTLSTAGSSGVSKVFTYVGNTVFSTTSNKNGSFSSGDSITLDAKRRPTNIRTFDNESKTSWSNFSFEYNGDDLLKVNQTSSFDNTTRTSLATYLNGNMISLAEPSSTASLEYFTDKKVQQGDYLEVLTLTQYGVSVYPHKNLVKSLTTGSSIINFNYEIGNDGLISKVTATTGSSVITLSYQYDCN